MKSKEEKSNPIYPEGLKTGDQVCIIDPANAFTEEALDAAASHLEARGLKVTVSEDMAFRRGTPKERAEKQSHLKLHANIPLSPSSSS